MQGKKKGFTLIEVLVVIGIIALLIAILLPALRKARQSAQTAACLSNLRQIGMAFHIYANENNGWLPSPGPNRDFRLLPNSISCSWPERLVLARAVKMNLPRNWSWTDPQGVRSHPIGQQLKGLFVCPAWSGTGADEWSRTTGGARGYGMSGELGMAPEKKDAAGWILAPYVRLSKLPKDRIILFDGYHVLGGAMKPDWVTVNTGPFKNSKGVLVNTTNQYKEYGIYMRHSNFANYLYSDWHAEWNQENHKFGNDPVQSPGTKWTIEKPVAGKYKIVTFAWELTAAP